jgi:twitching motility protein PilT
MQYNLNDLLSEAVERNASDLHINANRPPQFRIDGSLISARDEALSTDEARELCFNPLTQEQINRLESDREIDLAFEIPNLCRFRSNIYWSLNNIAGSFRPIPFIIPDSKTLGIPSIMFDFTKKARGLILITGPTGCGKSTTLATMIEYINTNKACHIVTLEDPIEFVFESKKATISQREVERDTLSFQRGLKYILRQDPDIVLIGEMRDLETIQSALTVAETGHLVLATLHTNTAVQTVDRIIDVFPPHQQPQIRMQVSTVLEAVVCQQLIPAVHGGRVLATEILVPHSGIRNTIRESKNHQIPSQMQTGQQQSGMHTMDQSLAGLVKESIVSRDEAFGACVDSDAFNTLLPT